MLYQVYQSWTDLMSPMRRGAAVALKIRDRIGGFPGPLDRNWAALLDLAANTQVTHRRPPFAIDTVLCGNRELAVREEVVLSLPFGDLLHFAKDDVLPKPKMLVIAPLSGHFPTLLRNTVQTLLRDHDVYITDWANARDVPLSAGDFGFDDYIDYVIRFIEELGPNANILAVCQPCVQALAAVSIMAEQGHPAQPRTMTLMGGPLDTRVAPTGVNELAMSKPLSWFRDKLISRVPWRHKGGGRKVYPGFLQLSAFMSMNMGRHMDQHRALYQLLADGNTAEAQGIKDFYEEYFAVLDLTAEFYLETIDRVFQRALLPQGLLEYRGRKIDPAAIRKTALLTVEGERDDICAVGQTAAAHDMCSSLRPHLKRHHLQPGVGHYGVFSGSKWERQIYPQVRNLVLAMN
ncbi:MAG: polyhydroxyalkanoate depolymerase, intracellular [Sphingomonas bacterium]|jgi:poly(3-hydroxybutyrate) depolymerase|nr:polyhydroxyalkanoate depolymerase, intracellular [Sphingomonas bacterium]